MKVDPMVAAVVAAKMGVPIGGAAGEVLAKKTNVYYDTEWTTCEGEGGGGGSGDLDGGSPSSVYGGVSPIDGGTP